MKGDSILSIELAVGAAVFVLGSRLFSLIQATRGVPDAHRQVVDALSSGDVEHLKKKARGLGYRSPYGEMAAGMIEASQREFEGPDERKSTLDRAAGVAKRRTVRRAQQGQAMDMLALCIALGIVVFARDGLPAGPVFWLLAGAVIILLLSSIVARSQLRASVLGSLEALQSVLVSRPQLPSLSDRPLVCFWCGQGTEQRPYDLIDAKSGAQERVLATVCDHCGKLVATLPADEADSSIDPASR